MPDIFSRRSSPKARRFQERTKGAADERLAEMREKATEARTWGKVEKVFDDRVGRALHAMNVPTRRDIDVLSRRVHDLATLTKKVAEEEETHGRGRAQGLNNKAKVTMRRSYGFRTFRILELALYHSLGKLPEPELTHEFF